jgi:hypothetical protein
MFWKIFESKKDEVCRPKMYYRTKDVEIFAGRLLQLNAGVGFAVHVIRNFCRVLVGKPLGKRLLERSRRQWKDNIKTCFKEVGVRI